MFALKIYVIVKGIEILVILFLDILSILFIPLNRFENIDDVIVGHPVYVIDLFI